MVPFLESNEFITLNVGVVMDVGISNPLDVITLFYQDKVAWNIQADCYGVAVHGSSFLATNSTATGKCINLINRITEFRGAQYEEFEPTIYNAKDYTSVSHNKINAGVANNILPQHMSMVFDIRLNEDKFEAQLKRWVEGAGTNITLTYIMKNHQSPATIIDETNPYWVAITNAVQKLNICVMPRVSAGSTDAHIVRSINIPAFGFSPMPNTPKLVHANDEYLNVDSFRHGIKIYEEIIYNMANIPADQTISDPFTYIDRKVS